MEVAKSQVLGGENSLLCVGSSIGWVETRLCDLEVKVAKQEAQIAALQCQAFLDEEVGEHKVAPLLNDSGNGKEGGLLDGVYVISEEPLWPIIVFIGPLEWEWNEGRIESDGVEVGGNVKEKK
jgi:hypothetical protein